MYNYRIEIEYDGGRYDGWQRLGKDASTNTIESRLCEIITRMTGETVDMYVGSRTEKGVHALCQTANLILFTKVPIYSLHEEGESGMSISELFRVKVFWLLMAMMLCAGASEQAVSQWASTFAEKGLHIQKTVGDLVGPMMFSVLMGLSRLIYGKYGEKLNLDRFMKGSCVLCVASYLCISLVPVPIVGLIGCAICGFSVGIMWPGTFSKASAAIKRGGTILFAMLALAGDLGCSGGPTLVGFVSSAFSGNLRLGILTAIVFPVLLLAGLCTFSRLVVKNVD